jgi:hypothetical protein
MLHHEHTDMKGGKETFAAVTGLWGNLAKAAVQREFKSTNAANDLMAAVSPKCLMLWGGGMSASAKRPAPARGFSFETESPVN